MISAASHQVIFLAMALSNTSCSFIIRSISAAVYGCRVSNLPASTPLFQSGQITCDEDRTDHMLATLASLRCMRAGRTYGINWMHTMKTAISVEDELLQEADRTAREMGLSRSRLFSVALKDFLKQRRNAAIVEQLNRVYAKGPTPEERRTLAFMKEKFRTTMKDPW